MKKGLSEKKSLKKLDITNFSAITEDNVGQFAELLPRMNPEVAKKALAQIPEFTKLGTHIVSTYKELLIKGYDESKDSTTAYYDSCNKILDTLQKELDKKFLTPKRRDKIIAQMIEVTHMIDRKDSEVKSFILKREFGVGAILFSTLALFASVLTFGKVNFKK